MSHSLFEVSGVKAIAILKPEESEISKPHCRAQIEIWEVGERAQKIVAWEYIIDGLRSIRTYSTEKEATGRR
jgi:hypothetical protein